MKIEEKINFTIPVNSKIIEAIVGGNETTDSACYAYEQRIENGELVIEKTDKWYHYKPTSMQNFTLIEIHKPDKKSKYRKIHSLSVNVLQSYTMDGIRGGEPFSAGYTVKQMKSFEMYSMDRFIWIGGIKGPKLIHVYDNGTFPPVVNVYSITNLECVKMNRGDRPILLNPSETIDGLELLNQPEEE